VTGLARAAYPYSSPPSSEDEVEEEEEEEGEEEEAVVGMSTSALIANWLL
jgi:hypothetical protein